MEKVLRCTHADNVQRTQLLVSIVLLTSDAVVCCLSILPWGVSSRGAAVLRFGLCSMRQVLLFCLSRVHNRGSDVIGRYYILCEDSVTDFV